MLSNLINPASVVLNMESSERDEALAELLENLVTKNPELGTKDARKSAFDSLVAREEKMSTAVIPHIAVPHAISKNINQTSVAIGISRSGIEFGLPEDIEPDEIEKFQKIGDDGVNVNIIFEILFTEKDAQMRLHILRDILNLTESEGFCKNILNATSESEICDLIRAIESEGSKQS